MTEYHKGTNCGYCGEPINDRYAMLIVTSKKAVLTHNRDLIEGESELEDSCSVSWTLEYAGSHLKQRVELTDKVE